MNYALHVRMSKSHVGLTHHTHTHTHKVQGKSNLDLRTTVASRRATWSEVTRLTGNKQRRHRRSLMDWQRGQDDVDKDDVAAETFGNLITSADEDHMKSIKKSIGRKAMRAESTAAIIGATTQRSNYAKTLHKIDGIAIEQQLEDDDDDRFVDAISDYEYEDVETKPEAKATTQRSRLQFGKSLNGNLRRAGKTVGHPSRMSELELEFKESSDSIALTSDTEASGITLVIDDYNQTDSSSSSSSPTSRQEVDAEHSTLTTLSGSDNDDIVEIDTSHSNVFSASDVIENDFEIKKKQEKKQQQLQTKPEQKTVVDDNNNERDLADNYGGNKNGSSSEGGQSESPIPQSINQTVAELMLSDAAHFDDNVEDVDDIDIVKLGGAGANNQSNEVDLYKTAAVAKESKAELPPASENEVLKEQEQEQPLDKVAYLTPLKPYVSERYDRPSKRILVNLTIATDDGSDSIYTLHVAVPTGRGSHDLEQLLTHEKRPKLPEETVDNNIDNLGACVPEPPPRMPDCPCVCLPPPPPTIINESNGALLMPLPVQEEAEPVRTATNTPGTVLDNNPTDTTSVTASDNDNDNANANDVTNTVTAAVTDAVTDDRSACPDVMPILILEGDCTVCCPANPYFVCF